jgi:hypothetical protein
MDKQAILDRVIAFLHAQGGPGTTAASIAPMTDAEARSAA